MIVAIPCFNEDKYIGSVVVRAKKYVDTVLVIDDGSTDDTAEVAELAGATVISHSRNIGKGAAIKTAFTWARDHDCDTLILLDGDGQHKPSDIPNLLKPIQDGRADMVVGSRLLTKNKTPLYRKVGQQILTFITNLGSKVKLSDSQSGFRAFSRKAIGLMAFSERGLSIESEMQLVASRHGLKVIEVPINVLYFDSSGKNPIVHGLDVLSRLLVMFSLQHPLVLFGLPAVILICSGLGMGMYVMSIFNANGQLAIGYSLATLLLSLSGFILLFLSLMLRAMKEILGSCIKEWK